MLARIAAKFGDFLRDGGANVAPIFAIALLPLFGMVGAAVDYSRANSARTSLFSALDSTALMLSKEANSITEIELKKRANDYFHSLFNNDHVKTMPVVTPTFTTPQQGSFKLAVATEAVVETSFARLLGVEEMKIGASSEVLWGMKRLEVALALDNTGSMSSLNKMTEMKKAVKNLLDTLHAAAKKTDDVRVSIIPFDTMVRIGTQVKDEFWISYSWIENQDLTKNDWTGCVDDRRQDYDVLDTSPIQGTTNTYFRARNCSSLAQMLPLTDIKDNLLPLKTKVDEMQPNGYTNVTIGLVWGWHALTANMPLNQAAAPQPDLDKVIILLTDGENTRNRFTTDTSDINLRTTAVCNNIRAANIKVYTIRVIEGNAALLKNCATKPDMYFDVQQASQLNGVFSTIAQNLANLRVAK